METELLPELGKIGAVREMPSRVRKTELRRFSSLQQAHAALHAGLVASIVRIPADYVSSGKLQEYLGPKREFDFSSGQVAAGSLLRPWLVRGLLNGRVDPPIAARAADPGLIERLVIAAKGGVAPADLIREIRPLIVPIGFGVLLLVSVFASRAYL